MKTLKPKNGLTAGAQCQAAQIRPADKEPAAPKIERRKL